MKNTKTGFSMKGYNDFFKPTDPDGIPKDENIRKLEIGKLIAFKNHPFKLYEGERLNDMVESVRANGVIMPIIVRPLDNGIYEILSGHNRVEAAKTVGLETISAVICEDLSDDDALLIVTETNLMQRSFSDLTHSERAAAVAIHHRANKNQGKRTDLINEIENLLKNNGNISNNAESETSAQFVQKLDARDKTAQNYGLNRGTISRYLRLYENLSLKYTDLLDSGEIPFIAAVELSYMSKTDQDDLNDILRSNPELKVDIKKAELLRKYSEDKELTVKMMEDILAGISVKKNKKKARASLAVQSLKIGGKILSKYFTAEDTPAEIEAELINALEYYRTHKNASETNQGE